MKNIVVVGAGIAGLSLAYELKKRGHAVTLIERSNVVGGLSRSFEHEKCILDVGVHLFYGKDAEVQSRVREVVPGEQWIRVKRSGKLYVMGREIDWPIRLTSLIQLPFSFGIKVVIDQLLKKKKALPPGTSSYQSELLNLYGPSLYYKFFHPLTAKFLQRNPAEVHADWAFSSLRAATKIEDKSFADSYEYLPDSTDEEAKQDFNIFKFLKDQLLLDTDNEEFYYFRDGYGVLGESFRTAFEKLGGKLLLQTSISKFDITDGKVTGCQVSNAQGIASTIPCEHVVWTGYQTDLCQLLGLPAVALKRLQSKFVYLFLKKPSKKHQVAYYADEDISFSRATILSNHSKTIIRNPAVKDVLCLEYTASDWPSLLQQSEKVRQDSVRDAVKTGLMKSADDLVAYHELNVPNSYPILSLDYKEKLAEVTKGISRFSNVWTSGRQGGFSYENADGLIKQSMHHEILKSL